MVRMEPMPEMYIGEGPVEGRWGCGCELVSLAVPFVVVW